MLIRSWLAMEDLNAANGTGATGGELRPSLSGQPFRDEVQSFKKLLNQMDPETATPLRS